MPDGVFSEKPGGSFDHVSTGKPGLAYHQLRAEGGSPIAPGAGQFWVSLNPGDRERVAAAAEGYKNDPEGLSREAARIKAEVFAGRGGRGGR